MKKSLLLFAGACLVIIYLTACTGIDKITTAVSAKHRVTKGAWKINLYTESKNDETFLFDNCMLTFEASGKIIAYKNQEKITGNWSQDDTLKTITIKFNTNDPALLKLNNHWNISDIKKWYVSFENSNNPEISRLQIASL